MMIIAKVYIAPTKLWTLFKAFICINSYLFFADEKTEAMN